MDSSTMAMNRLDNLTYSNLGEKLDWSYYDKLVLAAAGTEFTMFQVPVGQGGKTLADTNMKTAGQVPTNQGFIIRAVRAEFLSHAVKATADLELLYNWLRVVTVQLFIDGKDAIYQKPLTEIMGIPLLFHVTPTVAGNNELIGSMGRFLGINPLNIPIMLGRNTHFEVRITYPTALGAVNIVGDELRISLGGILERLS
jgi:hypothetical protein